MSAASSDALVLPTPLAYSSSTSIRQYGSLGMLSGVGGKMARATASCCLSWLIVPSGMRVVSLSSLSFSCCNRVFTNRRLAAASTSRVLSLVAAAKCAAESSHNAMRFLMFFSASPSLKWVLPRL